MDDPKNRDVLKVSNYEWDKIKRLQNDVSQSKNTMESENAEHSTFLDYMDERLGIDSAQAVSDPSSEKEHFSEPVSYRPFDEIIEEANAVIPEDVTIHDILSSEEIASARMHIEDIYDEFSKRTRLKRSDIVFLSTAVGLQVLRQYVLDPWLRKNRPNAGQNDEKGRKGNAGPGWYHADTDKILHNKVPFDAQRYSNNSTVKGLLKGAVNHRFVTLGHDPILGWVFGTMNILTNTITVSNLQSAHIKQQNNRNVIHSMASTFRIVSASIDRLLHEGLDGKKAVGFALAREALHLKSDVGTKLSIPIPILSAISPKTAAELSSYGIDTAGVGTGATLSIIINALIAIIHRLFYDRSVDDLKLFEIRTRKILLYSNFIASTSNAIISAFKFDLNKLDVGGLLVTISRLFSDTGYIARVQQEFVENRMAVDFRGTVDELDRLYHDKFSFS